MTVSMTKSELIAILTQRQGHLKAEDVDLAVKSLPAMMGGSLANGDRIDTRGFGSFSLPYPPHRTGCQPNPGHAVTPPAEEDRKTFVLDNVGILRFNPRGRR